MSNIRGDFDGVALWNLINSSTNPIDVEYASRLNSAATRYHSVWFTDPVLQAETKQNQAFWYMRWNGEHWNISLFHVPSGANKVSSRLVEDVTEEIEIIEDENWEKVNPEDIIA